MSSTLHQSDSNDETIEGEDFVAAHGFSNFLREELEYRSRNIIVFNVPMLNRPLRMNRIVEGIKMILRKFRHMYRIKLMAGLVLKDLHNNFVRVFYPSHNTNIYECTRPTFNPNRVLSFNLEHAIENFILKFIQKSGGVIPVLLNIEIFCSSS